MPDDDLTAAAKPAPRPFAIRDIHPEAAVDGFTKLDGTVRFYTFVKALFRPGIRVLDFGAGRGAWFLKDGSHMRRRLQDLRENGAYVVAADVDPVVRLHPASHAQVHVERGALLPFADGEFDLVVSDWVFEHVEDPQSIAAELIRITRPRGWICIRTANLWGYVTLFSRLLPNDLHRHVLPTIQPGREAVDVFPVHYRINTPDRFRRYFSGHAVSWYRDSAEPAYHFGSSWLYRTMLLGHRLLPDALATSLCAFIQVAPGPAAPPSA